MHARFEQHHREDPAVAEPQRLEHRQFAGALADRLRHGVGGDQQDHEHRRRGDRAA